MAPRGWFLLARWERKMTGVRRACRGPSGSGWAGMRTKRIVPMRVPAAQGPILSEVSVLEGDWLM